MTFVLEYELNYPEVMMAVINDARNTIPAIQGKGGNNIFSYSQSQIALVVPGVLLYRISTDTGNLSGYCAIRVTNGVGSLYFYQLRPAAQPFYIKILDIIANFNLQKGYLQDSIY